MDAFIDDGYTQHVGIEAVDGLHPSMTFVYRPFAGNEGIEALTQIQVGPTKLKLNGRRPSTKEAARIDKEQQQAAIKDRLLNTLVSRVKGWGFDRELSAESINRLNPRLFERLYGVVFGLDAPDYELDAEGKRIEPSDAEDDLKN